MVTVQEILEECITYNEAELASCDEFERHFWDGWDPEKVRQGTPFVYVTCSAPGLGHTSIFVLTLCVKLPDGGNTSVRDPHVIREATNRAARIGGREQYANRQARRLYGDLPVRYESIV